MMGTVGILFWSSIICFLALVCPSDSPPGIIHLKATVGDSVTLPCDGSRYKDIPHDQMDIWWQTSDHGEESVAHYLRGEPHVGVHFENRVSLPVERIKRGNFSITINSVQLSDENHYECCWKKEKLGEEFLEDVRLTVLEPSFSKNVSVSAGDQVILPCYFRISRQTPDEKLFVQWKVGDKVVLQLTSGEFTYGSKFRSRVDISLERIRQGNLSLHLRNTSRHDSGDYQCSIKNKNVIITLEVKDASRTGASPPQRYHPVQYLVIAFLLVVIILCIYAFMHYAFVDVKCCSKLRNEKGESDSVSSEYSLCDDS